MVGKERDEFEDEAGKGMHWQYEKKGEVRNIQISEDKPWEKVVQKKVKRKAKSRNIFE